MLKNFFKTATRNILKNKSYSAINFVGLTCGLALALLVIVYVSSELKFDQFHEKADRLYRISYTAPNGLKLASSPPPIAPKLGEYFPEVETAARVFGRNVSITLPEQAEAFEEDNIYFADSSFANMFTLEFLKGNPADALKEEYTVVITEEMAKKYFGEKNPIGETLIFSGHHSFKVTHVVREFPEYAHLRFNMLVPYENMFDIESDDTALALRKNLEVNFVISHSYTYVMLKSGAKPDSINAHMGDFIKKYAQPQFLVGQVFTLMPVTDIHLKSDLLAEPSSTNTMANIYIFIAVGMLTLIVACINYINLSTAQSFTRIREIGIRKILGSMKYQLIGQFIAESFIFVFASMVLAYVVFYYTLPLLNQVTEKNLLFSEVVDTQLVTASLALLALITILAGGYPAYFVTQFQSIAALKGAGTAGQGGQFLRKALVVFQLTIACMLLSGSLLIMKQMNFLLSQPLGFQREQIINVPLFSQNLNGIFRQNDSTFASRLEAFRHGVEEQSNVKGTALSSAAPGLGVMYRGAIPEGFTKEDNMFIANMAVDYDFLQSYGIELAAGRSFSKSYGTDEQDAFIVNETAVKEFKWETAQQAIGKEINREGKKGMVVGVVKDFNFTSLTAAVSAMIIEVNPSQYNVLSIRFHNSDIPETIKQIEARWNKIFPEKAFQYSFLDESLNSQYANFENFGKIIQTFTLIGILIACLGVYGLVMFTVQRKVKEIGVRKVLGASVSSILTLIYRDFALLISIGFLIAVPVSYYFLDQWMENFIYHTSIDVLTYGISFILILVIVTATVSFQAIRAAQANPVKSLRSE